MIKLQDCIRIRTTPEQIFKWFEAMPQEYSSWHPDHVACRVLKGSMFLVGSEIQCEEVLHGKLHVMRFRPTRVEAGKRLEYEIMGLGNGVFQVNQKGEEVEFVAELYLGSKTLFIGTLVDIILRSLFSSRLKVMRQHMREEGQNLKKIIESGWETRGLLEADE